MIRSGEHVVQRVEIRVELEEQRRGTWKPLAARCPVENRVGDDVAHCETWEYS